MSGACMSKNVIWQNVDLNVDDWRDDYQEYYGLSDEEMAEKDDDDIYGWADELNFMYLDDERANLNINVGDDIIVFGQIGRWDGTFDGYKVIRSGNIKDCLYDEDCALLEWYCDDNDFRFHGAHHDGENEYLYRTWADGVSEEEKEDFLSDVYVCGCIDEEMLGKFTKSLRPYIAEVYGW